MCLQTISTFWPAVTLNISKDDHCIYSKMLKRHRRRLHIWNRRTRRERTRGSIQTRLEQSEEWMFLSLENHGENKHCIDWVSVSPQQTRLYRDTVWHPHGFRGAVLIFNKWYFWCYHRFSCYQKKRSFSLCTYYFTVQLSYTMRTPCSSYHRMLPHPASDLIKDWSKD